MDDEQSDWYYFCDLCGRHFPIYLIPDEEWGRVAQYGRHLCKHCLEKTIPNPTYLSVDEYLKQQRGWIEREFLGKGFRKLWRILEKRLNPRVRRVDGILQEMRQDLSRVRGTAEETDDEMHHRLQAGKT
jgi:hypothetical protein